MKPINTAVVGYGYAGRCFHSYLIKLADGLRLSAISTRDPERQRRAHEEQKVKIYPSIKELLKDESIELVVIATPHDTHKDLALQVMKARKHCVVDKIMSMTYEEAEEMIEARDKYDVLLSVFHNRRWDGDFLTLKKVIKSGLIGYVFAIEEAVFSYGGPRGWRAERASCGGQLYDWGAHLIDHALLLGGKPKRLFCRAIWRKWETDVDSHCKLVLEFDDLLYTIELSRLARIPKPKFYALGELGTFRKYGLDPQESAMVAGNIDSAQESPESYPEVVTEVGGGLSTLRIETERGNWKAYYQNIADVLLRGAELAVKAEEASEVVRVAQKAMESAQKHRVLRL